MSPAPFNNEPRRRIDGEEDAEDLGPMDQIPPVTSDSSDVDSAEESIQPPGIDPAEVMGYQLLPQDVTHGGEHNDDDDDENDDFDNGNNSDHDEKQDEVILEDNIHVDNDDEASSNAVGFEVLLPEHLQMKSTPESTERRELWTSTTCTKDIPVMDSEQAEKIKSIMSGITLPSAHVPAWVGVVPEEEWKARLLNKIHQPPLK